MSEKPVKRYHMTHDRDFQRILAEVSGQEFLKFAQYVRSEDYDALKAEMETLRREAERYRWLQERLWFQHQWEVYDGSVQDLAAAIDAAMEDKT